MVSSPDAGADGTADGAAEALADQALASLVGQFARPLDCLRELVQNAIDAGSPRVAVWVRPAAGALEIHVDDFGEGMDEVAIDSNLTALFASDKEDDLTRIGKFGVGFASIFALNPQAVLVRTGRHGESWELLFHADRSFDKVRLERPVSGTRITLFVPVADGGAARLIQECRWVLTSWCEHSSTPITFEVRGQPAPASPAASDPFAAFDAPAAAPETVNRPLALAGELVIERQERGVHILIGLARAPRYGFYNGGLTLVNTADPAVLGDWEAPLGRYRFKVKADALEHTLTRDNVIHDEAWESVMGALHRAALSLVDALLERAARAVADGEPLAVWHRHLAVEALHMGARGPGLRWRRRFSTAPVFRGADGAPLTYRAIERAERRAGVIWLHPGGDGGQRRGGLAEALAGRGHILVEELSETRGLLMALAGAPGALNAASSSPRRLRRADEDFVRIEAVERGALPVRERALLKGCEALMERVGWRRTLAAGALAHGGWDWRERLTLAAGVDGVARRGASPRRWWRRRSDAPLFLNRDHPVYRAWLTLASQAPDRARFGLAQAILHDQSAPERVCRRLLARHLESGS